MKAGSTAISFSRSTAPVERTGDDVAPSRKQAAYCCSYPKSGRTWFRFLLAHYLNGIYDLGIDVDFHTLFQLLPNCNLVRNRGLRAYRFPGNRELPLVLFDHADFRPRFSQQPVIFVIRSVFDTLVSRYFHTSRREKRFDGTIHDYVRNTRIGLPQLIRYLNGWTDGLERCRHIVLSYESLHRDPAAAVLPIIKFLDLPEDVAILRKAVEASRLDRMRELERTRGYPNPRLNYDGNDVEALRARRGVVGGYRDNLRKDDVDYIRSTCTTDLSEKAWQLLEHCGDDVLSDLRMVDSHIRVNSKD